MAQLLLNLLVSGFTTATAGGILMLLHGVLTYCRLRRMQPLSECVTPWAGGVTLAAGVISVLLITAGDLAAPWDWLFSLALLVATGLVLLPWLGPPKEHVAACKLCRIGKGCAYSHHFGYLMLMQNRYEIRSRLEEFRRGNPAGLDPEVINRFYERAVVVPLPIKGEYSRGSFKELKGVGEVVGEVPGFSCNSRSYPSFKVHEVTSSSGDADKKYYVAMDSMDALVTLQKLRRYKPASLSTDKCEEQIREFMDEIEKIVGNYRYLRGQLKVVRYTPGHHVGDRIITAIEAEGN